MRDFALFPLCVLALAACASNRGIDPQDPSTTATTGASPAQVVICPEGSSYDPSKNVCFATASITAPSSKAEVATAPSTEGSGSISISCAFRNGWASVVPVDEYPDDDSMLMQGLIGLTEEPNFWTSNTDFAALSKYAAKRCTQQPARFNLPSGDYFVVVGEAETFQQRGAYEKNGMRRRVSIRMGAPQSIQVRNTDLTHAWFCISCPFVSFLDPITGEFLPPFVVLANRRSLGLRGTDRIQIRRVPIRNGRIQLRVAEAERELTHLDQLILEVNGHRLLPDNNPNSALASPDQLQVEISQGKQITANYYVDGIPDGFVDLTVIATGHYDPIPY